MPSLPSVSTMPVSNIETTGHNQRNYCRQSSHLMLQWP